MACIISPPVESRKGILILTTQDIKHLEGDPEFAKQIENFRSRYFVGLHHNWHPVDFRLPAGFDFHFLESKDLIFKQDELLFEMDACNFCPKVFEEPLGNPKWDVLIVGRTANFKRPFKTLETIRTIYDQGHALRVLWICPMENNPSENSEPYDLLALYNNLFTSAEKDLFTLLNPSSNFPFTFSRDELALFYQSSRIYVHFADFETRCRTAAYAFVAGIPVVGNKVIANILPQELQKEPTFYEVQGDDYSSTIIHALANKSATEQSECRKILSEKYSVVKLMDKVNEAFSPDPIFVIGDFWHNNLDTRLGASHLGKLSSNSYSSTLENFYETFAKLLEDQEVLIKLQSLPNPEFELDKILQSYENVLLTPQTTEFIRLQSHRKLEIKQSSRGRFRFQFYSAMKVLSKIPILSRFLMKFWSMTKRIFSAKG